MPDEPVPQHFTEDALQNAAEALHNAAFNSRIVPVGDVQHLRTLIESSWDRLSATHHLDGLAIADPLCFFLKLPQELPQDFSPDIPPFLIPWGWTGNWGASFTLTAQFRLANPVYSRIAIPQSEADLLRRLENSTPTIAFTRGKEILSAWKLDFSHPSSCNFINPHLERVRSFSAPTCFFDQDAHYWEVIDCVRSLESDLTKKDRLSLSWMRDYRNHCLILTATLEDLWSRYSAPPSSVDAPVSLRSLLEILEKSSRDLAAILASLAAQFQEAGYHLRTIAPVDTEVDDCYETNSYDWDEFRGLRNALYLLLLRSASETACGTQVIWLDHRDGRFKQLELNPAHFSPQFEIDQFWQDFRRDFPLGWGFALTGDDFPTSPRTLATALDKFPQCEGNRVADIDACADALLDEALANKRGTIPYRAILDHPIGPFVELELIETPKEVFVICRCEDGSVELHSVEPETHYCSFALPPREFGWGGGVPEVESIPDDLRASISTAVKQQFAAIIRDFWVIEERDRVFETTRRVSAGQRQTNNPKPRIVYVPRIRYTRQANVDRCVEQLGHQQRRAHFVRAHLRKSTSPSSLQLQLARRYGFDIPEGYTFVRPHERGKQARDIVYRSRSALQSLYSELVKSQTFQPNRWFRFERDVYALMESLGFDVQHVAASGRADNGIDVYATKGQDFDVVNWVIQCKCWRPNRTVYPSTVRELIGTLAGYSQGTRGMLVTTSRFSSGAKSLAEEHNIRLIDGEEFARLSG